MPVNYLLHKNQNKNLEHLSHKHLTKKEEKAKNNNSNYNKKKIDYSGPRSAGIQSKEFLTRSTREVSLTIKSSERPQNGRQASREALGRIATLSSVSLWTSPLVGAHAGFISF